MDGADASESSDAVTWPKQTELAAARARREIRVGELAAAGLPAVRIAATLGIPTRDVLDDLRAIGAIQTPPGQATKRGVR